VEVAQARRHGMGRSNRIPLSTVASLTSLTTLGFGSPVQRTTALQVLGQSFGEGSMRGDRSTLSMRNEVFVRIAGKRVTTQLEAGRLPVLPRYPGGVILAWFALFATAERDVEQLRRRPRLRPNAR